MQTEQTFYEQADLSVSTDSSEVIRQIGTVFTHNEYIRLAEETLAQVQNIQPEEKPPATSINPLLQLFLHSKPTTSSALNDLIKPLKIESLIEVGIIEVKKEIVIPLVKITPYNGLLITSDIHWQTGDNTPANAVAGVTRQTVWLSNLAQRTQVKLTLDSGTGSGVQALLAAAHSDKVIATDINPRALDFARFNAALNHIKNIEFAQGDLFGPVKGQKFDLILANPACVISPDNTYSYRDTDMEEDHFMQKMMDQIPAHLTDEGIAHVIGNWVQHSEENWQQRLIETTSKTDQCNKLLLCFESYSPAHYARNWLSGLSAELQESKNTDWLKYYEKNHIELIHAGLITLQKTSLQKNWFRIDTIPRQAINQDSESISKLFNLQNFLAEHETDQTLIKTRLTVSPYVRLIQSSQPQDNGWKMTSARMELTHGIAHSADIAPEIMGVIFHCNGQHSLEEILTEVAAIHDQKLEAILPNYLTPIKQLIAYGFLFPVEKHIASKKPLQAKMKQRKMH